MEIIKRIWSMVIITPLDFISKYFKSLIFLLILLLIFGSNTQQEINPNLAKLEIKNTILQSDDIRKEIQRIKEKRTIKGILLIVDSPGGGVGASIEIADMIKELRTHMPVIAYTPSVMASGGYYASMYADKIVANRGALIGSIGVIYASANVEDLLKKIGVKQQSIKAGKYKEVGIMTREWSSEEKTFLDSLVKEQYKMFTDDVLESRNLTNKNPDIFANGKIFSAKTALSLGLIDKVGSYEDAYKELLNASGVKNPIWLQKSKFDIYMDKFISSYSSAILNTLMGKML